MLNLSSPKIKTYTNATVIEALIKHYTQTNFILFITS